MKKNIFCVSVKFFFQKNKFLKENKKTNTKRPLGHNLEFEHQMDPQWTFHSVF